MGVARVLFLADTHLGFDLPFRPRIQRRRRGYDFFKNYETALQPALEARVDCVVHGGDILYRSKVPARLVEMTFEPLKRVADKGIPVYLVPGNHERSTIPHGHLASHPLIHVFDRPRTFMIQKDDFTLALAGFPFQRSGIRKDLLRLLDQTGWRHAKANGFLLCIHQSVDGATVGPANYMFRYAHDVVKITDIPPVFSAVLAGHLHRFQVLTKDLRRKPLATPVFYPGSIERTSFAEKEEKKGYLILEFETRGSMAGQLKHWKFHPLYARPMIQIELQAEALQTEELRSWLKNSFAQLPSDSVVKLRVNGNVSVETMEVLRAPSLRSLAPASMNIDATFMDYIADIYRKKKKW
jgi:DNA repair exonuclease SbcCD nuclease subunit